MGPWPLVIAISGQRGEDGATLREVDNFSRIHRVCGHISEHIKKVNSQLSMLWAWSAVQDDYECSRLKGRGRKRR